MVDLTKVEIEWLLIAMKSMEKDIDSIEILHEKWIRLYKKLENAQDNQ